MRIKSIILLFVLVNLILCCRNAHAQGNIEHIVNQEYMKGRTDYNCTDHPGDALSYRICANLEFQKSDSVLSVVYDSLIHAEELMDSIIVQLAELQSAWRKLRDQHCYIVYASYDCSACHERSTAYLYCLTELTNSRISELRNLKNYLLKQD